MGKKRRTHVPKMIRRLFRRSSLKAGLSPGSLIYTGEQEVAEVSLSLINYDQDKIVYSESRSIDEILTDLSDTGISWLNIKGLHDTEIIEKIGTRFNIHALNLEDILNTQQRPKCEVYEDYIYIVMKMITYDPGTKDIGVEQISIILGENYVISFQERSGDNFDPIRNRLQNAKGRHRRHGADYLLYALMDIIIDNYYVVLEQIGTAIEELEDLILSEPDSDHLIEIQHYKREILLIRKSIWPLRELVSGLRAEDTDLISDSIEPYLRDLYDHTVQVVETVEIFREMTGNVMDLYLSNLSNRMNEVMKVLTIIATIFIPLSFIAGVYGMNFDWMPELHWPFGYPLSLGVMIAIAGALLLYFHSKKWL